MIFIYFLGTVFWMALAIGYALDLIHTPVVAYIGACVAVSLIFNHKMEREAGKKIPS